MSADALPERGWATCHGPESGWADLTGKPALFLDRDGTVIENTPYLNDPAQVSVIPGAREAIAAFRAKGYAVIVVTNQSGVARGLVAPEQYRAVEAAVIAALGPGLVDATYVCPFYPEHPWRKPEPGMLLAAAQDLSLLLPRSIMVGDTLADVIAGTSAGVARVIHVLTGHGAEERSKVETWASSRDGESRRQVGFAGSLGELLPTGMNL